MVFIDFHKTFDSVETWAFLTAMDDAGIDSRYSTILKNIYKEATFQIKIDNDQKTGR